MNCKKLLNVIGMLSITFCTLNAAAQDASLGIFKDHTDIGPVKHAGKVSYNSSKQEYIISGSGGNIWFDKDEFHFVWRKMKGDFLLRTNAAFSGKGKALHRKWGWMIRTSLDPKSKHINAVVHGDGLTSLQYRPVADTETREMKSTVTFAEVVQLERKGNRYTMAVARKGMTFETKVLENLDLGDEVYVGLFVCAHNADLVETAIFNNVRIVIPAPADLVPYRKYIGSNLELLDVASQNSRIVYQSPGSIQAPNWNKDGRSLIYNSEGLLFHFDLDTKMPEVLNTGTIRKNNNDHVLSFDGKWLAISSGEGEKGASIGYVLPNTGGIPKRITNTGPSYMHGWSPDGKYLLFTGQRNAEFDVYRIPVTGGEETRLTNASGLDDGPEYTPDGKYIYFNSVRSGLMQIWRMNADGSEQTR